MPCEPLTTSENERRLLDDFVGSALSTMLWARRSGQLRRSAELLWKASTDARGAADVFDYSYGFLLVAATALETMLKAAAIQLALNRGGPSAVLDVTTLRFHKWVTTHDVARLFSRLQITFSDNSVYPDYITRFTSFLEWEARHPTVTSMAKVPHAGLMTGVALTSGDYRVFQELYGIAEAAYVGERQKAQAEQRMAL